MKTLKFTIVLAMLLFAGTFAVAQDYSEYYNAAVRLLDEGDCVKAEQNYNVYKKLTGKTSAFVEKGIVECKGANKLSANGAKQIQINFQNYEVLPTDLDGTYKWAEAKSACDNLIAFGKSDWYLPTKAELAGLYKHKDEIGGFSDGWNWWSSSEYDSYSAWFLSFSGRQDRIVKYYDYSVRCIRKN